jgi:hypothetical protein
VIPCHVDTPSGLCDNPPRELLVEIFNQLPGPVYPGWRHHQAPGLPLRSSPMEVVIVLILAYAFYILAPIALSGLFCRGR